MLTISQCSYNTILLSSENDIMIIARNIYKLIEQSNRLKIIMQYSSTCYPYPLWIQFASGDCQMDEFKKIHLISNTINAILELLEEYIFSSTFAYLNDSAIVNILCTSKSQGQRKKAEVNMENVFSFHSVSRNSIKLS